MKLLAKKTALHLAVATSLLVLAGCGDNDLELPTPTPVPAPAPAPAPAPVSVSYDVTVTNLTNAQPLSPVAVVLHDEGQLWQLGQPATEALEIMAEGGDNSDLLGLSVVLAQASGAAPIGPGASETITVTIDDRTDTLLSTATMLVNTNDAFSGLNAYDLSELAVGESVSFTTRVYDAGTEANSEAMDTIPGPADGGEGYNAERDDVEFVALHPGVVSIDDGLSSSVLSVVHKFDNPAVRFSITRIE